MWVSCLPLCPGPQGGGGGQGSQGLGGAGVGGSLLSFPLPSPAWRPLSGLPFACLPAPSGREASRMRDKRSQILGTPAFRALDGRAQSKPGCRPSWVSPSLSVARISGLRSHVAAALVREGQCMVLPGLCPEHLGSLLATAWDPGKPWKRGGPLARCRRWSGWAPAPRLGVRGHPPRCTVAAHTGATYLGNVPFTSHLWN